LKNTRGSFSQNSVGFGKSSGKSVLKAGFSRILSKTNRVLDRIGFPLQNAVLQGFSLKNRRTGATGNRVITHVQ
jgi:cobyric acid synthase